MSTYRKWDESRSPQWKYLLQKESIKRRKTRKEIEKERAQTALEEKPPKHAHSTKRRISATKKRGTGKVRKYVRTELGVMREVNQDTSTNTIDTLTWKENDTQ